MPSPVPIELGSNCPSLPLNFFFSCIVVSIYYIFSLENSLYVHLDTKEFVCSMPILYWNADDVLQFGMRPWRNLTSIWMKEPVLYKSGRNSFVDSMFKCQAKISNEI